ncbi:TetR/AcrR family transcriptional regulator [Amycolatopsis sp. WQ 127309]|uniref:TetR/AcrR family transcriptional regulator n=1 Tax=Amycolatopsis sp. WQ 127309 TaxID=2932773 RepID=UPI001FF46FD9|nr:TetR/AcrR family transcriptional regulator [Amycolatopsis sp. WQ 127309]UOZ03481.1 TetR/AcrR family transcriptional regulator [Amycolatopsis sp. WQ 127309]
MTTNPERAMRADAVRTRKALLEAAATVFADIGEEATVAQIAARAGIAKGTVFRHFPTKDELLAAIVADAVDELVAAADRVAARDDADAALLEFMRVGAGTYARNRALVQVLDSAGAARHAGVQAQVERLITAAERLAGRARRAGTLRPDVHGQDVVLLTCGVYHAALPLLDEHPDACDRYLDMLFAGLRTTERGATAPG